ncbi:hypothetical protein [Neobacillus sp. 19]|uniref:hypothetical protein n=1 Tax=Neobacillus sp. 19 TaxID=3394458 RepID=UPI003BF662A7
MVERFARFSCAASLISEQITATLDGAKLFALSSPFGRNVNPGMEGSRLKIVIKTKEFGTAEWLHIVSELVKGIPLAKRGQENPVK